jgi:phosphatidylserine/phosphatidylglycerophosphate/cardiolipin synthase-like enzyme
MEGLRRLSHPAMLALADALAAGRVDLAGHRLGELVPDAETAGLGAELQELARAGLAGPQVALVLRMLAAERAEAQAVADRYQLVWSGEESGAETRSTPIVVKQLFLEARHSVLVASYAFDHGENASVLFAGLAERMDTEPALSVRFFVNVDRKYNDPRTDGELLRAFADRFRESIWPGKRLPEVFYDPRALVLGDQRACLHAKCVVIDGNAAFITSANFTEAAHERNYEAGMLVRDRRIAGALARQFESLAAAGRLRRVAA